MIKQRSVADAFSATRGRSAIPLQIVPLNDYQKWLASQPARVRAWIRRTLFEPAIGKPLLIRDGSGSLERVLVPVSEPVSMWDLAELPNLVPAHEYVLLGTNGSEQIAALSLGWALGSYHYDRYRTDNETVRKAARPLARLVLPQGGDRDDVLRAAHATWCVRDWVNTPASDMGPAELEAIGRALARRFRGSCKVIRGDALLRANYPMIHAVGRASTRQPRLIDLRFGPAGAPKVTLVGKGVVFDSGGLGIKSYEDMMYMKMDMSGAAHAFALAEMILNARLRLRLRVLVPAVENAISGNAYRSLDILPSRKGLTVEVGSTDCEGRLILGDALAEADTESPEVLFDFATLSGFEAGGGVMGAFFVRDDEVAARLTALSNQLEDPIWRMPLTPLLVHRLRGKSADITNTGSIPAGKTVRAALFLSHFVDQARTWVHVDLSDGNEENRPGRPFGAEAFSIRACFAYVQERFGTTGRGHRRTA